MGVVRQFITFWRTIQIQTNTTMSKRFRLNDARYMSLDQALGLRQGETIEGIENLRVIGVQPRKVGDRDGRKWCYQLLEVEQNGTRSDLKVWGFPDLSGFKNGVINVECCLNAKNEVFGVELNEYKNTPQIKVDDRGLIDLLDSRDEPMEQEHNRIAHAGVFQADGGGRGQERQPARQEARGGRGGDRGGRQDTSAQAPARQQSQRGQTASPPKSGKQPIMGVTVGMALNQANLILIATHKDTGGYFFSPDYPRDLHVIASDIVRVADYMQDGNLAPKASKRNAAQHEEAQEPQQEQPRRQREPEPAPAPDPVKEEESYHDGMEEDQIPF